MTNSVPKQLLATILISYGDYDLIRNTAIHKLNFH